MTPLIYPKEFIIGSMIIEESTNSTFVWYSIKYSTISKKKPY